MRVAMFHGLDLPITVENLPDPKPGPDEILVRVHRCGLCGSDVSMTAGGPASLPLGRFGHEWAGEVIEVGRNVEGLRPGARIAALPKPQCGHCGECRGEGNPLFCDNSEYLVGGFGEYMVVPPVVAVPLPHSLSYTDGALVEPMSCGLHAMNLARMEAGARLLIIGAGAMALSVVYWARRLGAGRIAVLSRSSHRDEAVLAMGADAVLSFAEEDRLRIAEVLGGHPDIVAECVGEVGMLDLATRHVRRRGTIVSLGMCMHGDPVMPALCTNKEMTLLFPHGYTAREFEQTARAFDTGKIAPEVMVSDTIGLEALPQVLGELHAGTRKSLKVHVDPTLT
jgi:(R,R)-butanediol dehydrogenase/meso-butanediol dehydrogenase/diacetyl reductase